MIYEYDYQAAPEDQSNEQMQIPNVESEFLTAKAFLQKCSTLSGDNMYDHLTDVLNKILAERPENVIDFFEEYSRKMKEKRFKSQTDHLEDMYIPSARFALAQKLMPFFKPQPPMEGSTMDPEDLEMADMSRNDMMQLSYFFEQAGLGLPRSEMFYLMLSMRKLIHTEPIASIKFWGKIQGLYKNYYIVETELKEDEYMKRNEFVLEIPQEVELGAGSNALEKALDNIEKTKDAEGEGAIPSKVPRLLPPAPVSRYEESSEPPAELSGVGVNKKVYYVCNEVCDEWIQLPDVTPTQIQIARNIIKSFTGLLEQEVVTYPAFPGNEMNYLRAQIARISAGTQISPLGFYTFKDQGGGDEEEEEVAEEEEAGEGGTKTNYKENSRYDPIPITDLVDGSMSFWVHHTLYILPQGRTSWWNPNPADGGEGMDEEMGEEEETGKPDVAGAEPETGPPLLTPLSEDASAEATPAWSVRTSSNLIPDYAIAVVRSHLWPGAYCFANQGKMFYNVYLGFGHKYMSHNFTPYPLPPVEQDYLLGPEIMEMKDATGAEEEQWRIDHLPEEKPSKSEFGEEGEEEGEGEEEEEAD